MTSSYTRAFLTISPLCLAVLAGTTARPDAGAAPTQYVRPMIGTAGDGHTYPGATVPFGMVQLSPDTYLEPDRRNVSELWKTCSGYHRSNDWMYGFSHTHLSGTGFPDLGDIRFIPLSGPLPASAQWSKLRYRLAHDKETARPGYYRVLLDEPAIEVELTATARVGMHRYRFPVGLPAHLLIDVDRGMSWWTPSALKGCITLEGDRTVSGYRRSQGRTDDKVFFFVAEFSRPFESSGIELEGKTVSGPKGEGRHVFAHLDFPASGEPLVVRVGVSAVSIEGARKNLAAEIGSFDFDAVAAAADRSWGDVLGRIEMETPDPAVRETFYTALYHACLAPTLYNDVDGSYWGADRRVHTASFSYYTTFSLWDTFRAEHPLLTILQPQRVNDFVNSMLAHYRDFDRYMLPVLTVAGREIWAMIGNHAISVIAEAYAKGFRGYDAETAFEAMRDTSMYDLAVMGLYRHIGYVDSSGCNQSVSRTLEYAYDDWCVARMATMLGKKDAAAYYFKQSQNYRNVFDTSVGFVRGKTFRGTWATPFKPTDAPIADFTEGTSWNYTWFVPHDVPGLVGLLGGEKAAAEKLDQMFAEKPPDDAPCHDMSGWIGQYVHGNEPCHQVAYLYNYFGEPWKTQQRVRQIMTTLYSNKEDGLCGNDDCGQMSAWYVLSAVGFYPVNPASGIYVLGSPLVDRATIHLDPKYCRGCTFTIVAKHNSPENVYVQSVALNGKPLLRSWISHAELAAGGELVFEMGPKPNVAWARELNDRPPAVMPEE
jgi:predicted alpha-1,2-mannosidase